MAYWTTGMDYWNTGMDYWNTGMDYWPYLTCAQDGKGGAWTVQYSNLVLQLLR